MSIIRGVNRSRSHRSTLEFEGCFWLYSVSRPEIVKTAGAVASTIAD